MITNEVSHRSNHLEIPILTYAIWWTRVAFSWTVYYKTGGDCTKDTKYFHPEKS